jgi:hypothetical protein
MRGPRSIGSYLVLPRPGDLGKAIILPLGFASGSLLTSVPTLHNLSRAMVVWFAVEYLAYQARYQWNDIRGFWGDQLHPDCDTRGRLPGPAEMARKHIELSGAAAIARLLVAVLLVVALPFFDLAGVLTGSVVAVFVVAAIYEWVRSHAGRCDSAQRPAASCVVLWVVSGGGYCVRGLTGLVLATGTPVPSAGVMFAGIACWFAGVVFVTTRWAVESIPFATRRDGRLHWAADPDAGRGHLIALAHWLPQDPDAAPANLRSWRPLRSGTPRHAPWNVALVVALGSAWLAGAAFTTTIVTPVVASAVSASAVLVAWTVMVMRPGLIAGAAAMLVLLAAALAVSGTPKPAVLSGVVCMVYLVCTRQCLDDVGTLYQRRIRSAFAVVTALWSRPSPPMPPTEPTAVGRGIQR